LGWGKYRHGGPSFLDMEKKAQKNLIDIKNEIPNNNSERALEY
jgi:hypothetical protein